MNRYYMVFKSTAGVLAEEYVDFFGTRIDQVLSYPRKGTSSYTDKGIPHPKKPWRLLIIDERAEPHLAPSERDLLVSWEELEEDGWFESPI